MQLSGPQFLRPDASLAARCAAPLASETGGEVVIPPDFKLAAWLLVLGPAVLYVPWVFGGFFFLLGILLLVQTFRIRFVFDETAFEVKTKEFSAESIGADITALFKGASGDAALGSTGENFAVGGANRWEYSSFVNYEFFPSQRLPVLVYFKETATPSDKWEVGPGKWANSEEALKKGAVSGQVHFFPCIASADLIKSQFEAKGCAKL